VVKGAGHSWLIKDPEALPAVMRELRRGVLGRAIETAVLRARRPRRASGDGVGRDDLEGLFTERGALVGQLAGSAGHLLVDRLPPRPSRYTFEFHRGPP
jgi:hypothetical protein